MPSESATSTTNAVVPNKFPNVQPTTCRLAVVGEAPGPDEVIAGEPFVGVSGRFLRAILGTVGVASQQVFFGNICQHRPPGNDIDAFEWDGVEIQDGLRKLEDDLQRFRPNCVLVLGKTAFRGFRPDLCYPTKKGYVVPLANWRGSVCTSTAIGTYKIIGTYHPAFILRSYTDLPYFKFDLARAARHGSAVQQQKHERVSNLRPVLGQVLSFVSGCRLDSAKIAFDIEGFADDVGVTMYSIYREDTRSGIVIPFWLNGTNYWNAEEEVQVWQATAELLADQSVPKAAHNAFYELFVFAWRHRCVVNNLHDDTMMKHWECFPELERALDVCTSIYTEQPYYKDARLSNDPDVKLNYNFLDSAVTSEVNVETEKQLQKQSKSLAHYRFNINLIPAFNYLALRGLKLDPDKVASLRLEVEQEVETLNDEIRTTLGSEFEKYPGYDRKIAKSGFNVKSSPQKCWLIYDHLGYKELKRWGRTADEDALLHFHAKDRNPILRLILRCVRKRTRLSDINKLIPDSDGRIRTSLDLVGTPTGRVSSRASIALRSVDGEWEHSGTNLQNVTKDLRVCFIPDDPTKEFIQTDLSGADGWTVAAELAALGQTTMLDDYLAGIKPALVLCVMLEEKEAGRDPALINFLQRDALKVRCKELKLRLDAAEGTKTDAGWPADWRYFCCKVVQHSSNYGAQPKKTAEIVFSESDGVIDLSEKDAALYQYFYKLRYKTDLRNQWIARCLSDKGYLESSCGIRRQFFAIRNRREIDDSIVREAASFNPQAITTWATNKALERLWYDPQNRTSKGSLFIEPLHQIHDALLTQSRLVHHDFAKSKIPEWFDNPITIGKIEVRIPAESKSGSDWKNCKTNL